MSYPAMQLELYGICDVCGRIQFGHETGLRNPGHLSCREALDRWIRFDNLDFLATLDLDERGWRRNYWQTAL